MSAKIHPRLIGAFVLGAIAILFAAVMLLSSRDWLASADRFAVFFPGSVRGLNAGSPVTFRGVKLGEVKEVTAFLTAKEPIVQIEVVFEFQRNVIKTPEGQVQALASLRGAALAQALIDRGIRAQMQSQSLLTGQRYIELDFLPNAPARFSGVSRRYPELPTTPTSLERLGEKGTELFDKIAVLPIDQMLDDLRQALASLRAILESQDLRGAVTGARRVSEELTPALVEARATLANVRRTVDRLDLELVDTSASAQATLRETREALARAERTFDHIDRTAAGTDEARVTASQTLAELTEALKAFRNLVDYVQTHPEAVVLGKAKKEAP